MTKDSSEFRVAEFTFGSSHNKKFILKIVC